MFAIAHPDKKEEPWRGARFTINNTAGFNKDIIKNLGTDHQRQTRIKYFMEQEAVKEFLGDKFIRQFLEREPKFWYQQRAFAIDFANSG